MTITKAIKILRSKNISVGTGFANKTYRLTYWNTGKVKIIADIYVNSEELKKYAQEFLDISTKNQNNTCA